MWDLDNEESIEEFEGGSEEREAEGEHAETGQDFIDNGIEINREIIQKQHSFGADRKIQPA